MNQIAFARGLTVQSAEQVSSKIKFQFSKGTSKPEPVIFYHVGRDKYVGLIGSEAKSLLTSLYVAYAQAVSLSCDLALHLLTYIDRKNVIVPFIVTSWECAQVGLVYLVADSYPCSTMISRVFNFNDLDDLNALCAWIIALGNHCLRMVEIISVPNVANLKRKLGSKGSSESINCVLSLRSYLCKPLDVEDSLSRSRLTYLLAMFYQLWRDESIRQYIVFPEGVIGYPEDIQEDLRTGINASIRSFRGLKGVGEEYSPLYPGQPIILYNELKASEGWKRGDIIVNEDYEVKIKFAVKLTEITRAIEAAGIIHWDLRLINLFYRCIYNLLNF
jgi:hypothetical protein